MTSHYVDVAGPVKPAIHLNTPPRAFRRAIVAAGLLNEGRLGSVIKAAYVANVARVTMYAALHVVRHGDADLIADVLAGRISLHRAAVVARSQAKRFARQAKRHGGILAGEVRP